MSLAHLIQQNYERYLTENSRPGKCWFFVHIPKTAGSSFRKDLASLYERAYNIHIDADDRAVSYEQKIEDAVKLFNANFAETQFQFVSGHVPMTTLMAIVDEWQEMRFVTMLRDPVSRVVSDYRYQCTPTHPQYRQFIETFPTFESYYETSWTQNRMFQYLRPSDHATLDECIDFIVRRFAAVGITELYPLSLRLVIGLMQAEHGSCSHERRTEEAEVNRVELTPPVVARLGQLNAIDVELYEFFSTILARLDHWYASAGQPQSQAVEWQTAHSRLPTCELRK